MGTQFLHILFHLSAATGNMFSLSFPKCCRILLEEVALNSLSNRVMHCSQKLLRSPRKPTRKISKIPFKVLDAPELQDDFYLNLVDWSSLNVLSVGLGTCVYLWSACTSQVCELLIEYNETKRHPAEVLTVPHRKYLILCMCFSLKWCFYKPRFQK